MKVNQIEGDSEVDAVGVPDNQDPNEFLLAEYSAYAKDVAEGDPMAFDDWLAGSDLPEIVKARELAMVQGRKQPSQGKIATGNACVTICP